MNSHPARSRSLEQLASRPFDLLVIGAGIVGSRVAYEAARAGLAVALVDKGDFAAATSSASSKLIHGGLRYLAMYDFGLVHEAHQERRALLQKVAPHLVRRLDFVLPLYKGGPHSPAVIAAGLLLYSAMSGFKSSTARMIGRARARALVPALKQDGLRAAGLFQDAQTNDARLTLANVAAAQKAGATVANYVKVEELHGSTGSISAARLTAIPEGRGFDLGCRAVINASGPWVDSIRRLEDPSAHTSIRLSKGVHITLPLTGQWKAALITPLQGDRVTFAIPWEGVLLLGTTDTAYEGDPDRLQATDEDVETVLREAGLSLPEEMLRPSSILYKFAGLRALPTSGSNTAHAPREHVVSVGKKGMISVAGGKLTTHRRIALDVLRHLPPEILPRRIKLDETPLPGSAPLPPRDSDRALYDHLAHLYGSELSEVLGYRQAEANALDPIAPGGPDIWAQVYYARDGEWAVTADDVLRRRTTVAIRGLASDEVRGKVERALQ